MSTNMTVPAVQARCLLERITPLLRLPTAHDMPPQVLADGSGLRCPITERIFPYRNGVLDLLGDGLEKTFTQHILDTSLTAWAYDRFRGWITPTLSVPDFDLEVAHTQEVLQAQNGDVILDLACGQGNFTVEWARRVGREGLVIGLDISGAMLTRAAYHVRRRGLDNVLLIRGDAQQLPFADGVFHKVNCSGGFHQFPDLTQALGEIARVSATGAVLTTSTFAEGPDDPHVRLKHRLKRRLELHFVPLVWLGEQLTAMGYTGYEWSLPGGWFGYASARKAIRDA
jgi:ubiquinone/menaquinone biosynthesis C-methylase UbiE